MKQSLQQFASDNYAGICPEAWAAMAHANQGHEPAYGDVTWRAGVDILCVGGTKNGMASGEAIILFSRAMAEDFGYRYKQAGQLASKMRFLTAPWIGVLEGGAWLRHAAHANTSARLFASLVEGLPGISLRYPVQANSVFLNMTEPVVDELRRKGWRFYTFMGGSARFMFAWDTETDRVRALSADIKQLALAELPCFSLRRYMYSYAGHLEW